MNSSGTDTGRVCVSCQLITGLCFHLSPQITLVASVSLYSSLRLRVQYITLLLANKGGDNFTSFIY